MKKIFNTISQNNKQDVYDRLLLNYMTKKHKEEMQKEKYVFVRNLTIATLLTVILTCLYFLT